MKRISMIAAALSVAAVVQAQQATTASKNAPPTLIKNATVMTVTKGTMENTDILLENGKIAKIGKNLTAPAGATVIDGTGKWVMPGIIDPHSHMMADAINEGSLSVTSMVRMTDVLNPKVALFFLAFLPQFVNADSPHKTMAFLLLGLMFISTGTLWCFTIAALAARAASRLRQSGGALVWINRALGGVFVYLGVRIAALQAR